MEGRQLHYQTNVKFGEHQAKYNCSPEERTLSQYILYYSEILDLMFTNVHICLMVELSALHVSTCIGYKYYIHIVLCSELL